MRENIYTTYVLYSRSYDKIYIGQTDALELRLVKHNDGLSRFTKRHTPWELFYYEEFETRAEAMRRKKELKSHKGREFIRNLLLNGGVRQLPD